MEIKFATLYLMLLVYVKCAPESVTHLPGYTQLTQDEVRDLQRRGFGSTVRSFRPTVAYREDDEYDYDSEAESSQDRTPTYANQNYPIPIKSTLQPTYQQKVYPTPKPERRLVQKPQQFIRREEDIEDGNKLEEEKEEEEPDRLSLLLPQSRFNCAGRKTGYYADEDLACEVFHYCQDNAKHSWICPDGFTFHQVHLICMPPGGDNICEKSTDYHFVNDFLYKPVNLEEYQTKPNVTLRYSDRYYPDSYRPKYEEEDDDEERPVNHHQHSIRVTSQPRASTFRPSPQVYRNPEEINIPLQQRRPIAPYTNQY